MNPAVYKSAKSKEFRSCFLNIPKEDIGSKAASYSPSPFLISRASDFYRKRKNSDNRYKPKGKQNSLDNLDIRTDTYMIIGIPLSSWQQSPPMNSLIQAVGERGQVVGRAIFTGGFLGMVLYGDDTTTPQIEEGLLTGESFTLEIVQQGTKTTSKAAIDLKNWQKGSGLFTKNTINVIGTSNQAMEEPEHGITSFQILPNPNDGKFRIELESTKEEIIRISIQSLQGRQVFELTSLPLIKGKNAIEIPLLPIANGTYMVYLQGESFRLGKQVIVNK